MATAVLSKGERRSRMWWFRGALCGAFAALLVTASCLPAGGFLAIGFGLVLFNLLAVVFSVRAATRRTLPPAARRGWWLLSAGFLMLNFVPVALGLSGALASSSPQEGFAHPPSYGDLLRLLAVLPMQAGLVTFPRSNVTRRDGLKLGLDVLTVVGGCFMVIWYFVLGPVLTACLPILTLVTAAAYPIGDLTLIFGASVVVLRGGHPAIRRPMALLAAGMSLSIIADTYLGYGKLHPDDASYPQVQLVVVMGALFLFALAGVEQCLVAAAPARPVGDRPSRLGSRLPYVALAGGCGLLVVVALRTGLYPWIGLIGGAVLMTATVAARQLISLRENHDLITRDGLTNLANRGRLHELAAVAVDRANRTGERVAVLVIDLDGFKAVNDRLGHHAGDQVLVGFAGQLRNSVLGSDVVARVGGDEFVVLLHDVGGPENASAVADRIVAAMRTPVTVDGAAMFTAASIGIAISEPGVDTSPQDLLHRADMAMYQAKARPGNCYLHYGDRLLEKSV